MPDKFLHPFVNIRMNKGIKVLGNASSCYEGNTMSESKIIKIQVNGVKC